MPGRLNPMRSFEDLSQIYAPQDSWSSGIFGQGSIENNQYNPSMQEGFTGYTNPLDKTKSSGWGMPALNLAQGAAETYLGLKQLGLAEDAFDFTKESFNKQFGAQQKLTNADLRWQDKARRDRSPEYSGKLVQI